MMELLPPNATPLERALADLGRWIEVPAPLSTLWSVDRCPVDLLPWLAWALSVDDWDDGWPEARQRAAIAESVELHRHKGTPWAVRRSIEALGYRDVALVEGRQTAFADGQHSAAGRIRADAGRQWAEYTLRLALPDGAFDRRAQARVRARAETFGRASAHLHALSPGITTTVRRLRAPTGSQAPLLRGRHAGSRGPLDGRYLADGSRRGDGAPHFRQAPSLRLSPRGVPGPTLLADGSLRVIDAMLIWLVAGESLQTRRVPVCRTRTVAVTRDRRRQVLRTADGSALADGSRRAADPIELISRFTRHEVVF